LVTNCSNLPDEEVDSSVLLTYILWFKICPCTFLMIKRIPYFHNINNTADYENPRKLPCQQQCFIKLLRLSCTCIFCNYIFYTENCIHFILSYFEYTWLLYLDNSHCIINKLNKWLGLELCFIIHSHFFMFITY